jgi:hypothetical protein
MKANGTMSKDQRKRLSDSMKKSWEKRRKKHTVTIDPLTLHPDAKKPIRLKPGDELFVQMGDIPRIIETETNRVNTGKSAAFSSKKSLYYHDIPPEFYRRTALRHTGGHTKYNDDPVPITMNLNWRIGLDDPLYVMDRLNHMFEHYVDLLEYGNLKDDNLGAISWCCAFLMECERLHPDVFNEVIGQSKYSGSAAEDKKKLLQGIKK